MDPYVPRAADSTVLHGVVRDHIEEFLATAAARTDGSGLPAFIEREFRGFLRCGLLVHGFCRVRCDDCAFERLVPFSCKARAVCPSCGGRRMAERAAHLEDPVVIRKILTHLGLPTEAVAPRPPPRDLFDG